MTEPRELSPPVGHIDICGYDPVESRVHWCGWSVFLDGPADRLSARVDGADPIAARRIDRSDLRDAYPHIPGIETSGYEFQFPVRKLNPGDQISLSLVHERDDRPTQELPIGFRIPSEDYPVPDPDLMERVSGVRESDYFLITGNRHANDVVRMLRPHRSETRIRAFLDWGCGCGRVTRHLAGCLPNAEIHGTDIDAEAIEWLSGAMPQGEFHATGFSPPLPYENEKFDLILASSVFTHLTESMQAAWLQEMSRVLVPGGILMATTHGRFAARVCQDRDVDAALDSTGFFDGMGDSNLGDVASEEYYRSTFQTFEYTRQHWGAWFEELAMHEAAFNFHQDMWVLRKPRSAWDSIRRIVTWPRRALRRSPRRR